MPTIIADKVLFLMPCSRELLFPAFGAVQAVTYTFQNRMCQQDTAPQISDKEYKLHYGLSMDWRELLFFNEIGLKLPQAPQRFEDPDAVIDLREERLAMFENCSKMHVVDIYGVLCGVTVPPCTAIRQVKHSEQNRWAVVGDVNCPFPSEKITGEQLMRIQDNEWTGMVGRQSWETALAAAQGLFVIEILPAGKSNRRLSKWFNPHYRMVEEEFGDVPRQLLQAHGNLSKELCLLPVDIPVLERNATSSPYLNAGVSVANIR